MDNAGTLTVGPKRVDPVAGSAALRARAQDPVDKRVFDRLTRLVAALLEAPVSLLMISDADDLVFASFAGPADPWGSLRSFPLTDAYCQYAIGSREPFVVEDALADPVVRDLPPTTDLGVVAYLGVPLLTSGGEPIGILCAIDLEARSWSERDIGVVKELAATVMAYIETRPTGTERASGGLNIAAVARKTGIASDTLRKWERRYGVLRPSRTPGGQRRYDDNDVARVEWLRDRLAEGFRISEAAALLDPAGETAFASADEMRAALVDAAHAADPARLIALVEQTFALNPVETAIEEIVRPALEEIGSDWAERSGAIAEEHLLTETVRARLERMLADRRPGLRGKAVLACGPDERHDLGLLALAVLLQADGWLVAYLGADIPLDAVLELAEQIEADALCVSFTLTDSYERFVADLADVTLPDRLTVVVGGAAAPQQRGLAEIVAGLRA